ncbi:hypothetical protein GCM10020218_018370 [Dactylosporangium vinaceum]
MPICQAPVHVCSQTYHLVLEPDADGGHFTILAVAYVPYLVSQHADGDASTSAGLPPATTSQSAWRRRLR